jgi:hypothetical protein
VAREIVWTDPAWDDLENAADYIPGIPNSMLLPLSTKLRKRLLHSRTLPNEARLFQNSMMNLSENCSLDRIVWFTEFPKNRL